MCVVVLRLLELLLACRLGNFEIAEMLVVAGAGVSAANERGDTPLLTSVGTGTLELAEMHVTKGANVEAVRKEDYSPWSSSRSGQSCSTLLSSVTPKDWNTKTSYLQHRLCDECEAPPPPRTVASHSSLSNQATSLKPDPL